MKDILVPIVQNDELHARWLNSLSFMENMGARKISACEDSTNVGIVQLKHAAEEHRHAYYLKKQLLKLPVQGYQTYRPQDLLAAISTRQYLHRLDMLCSRYLRKELGLRDQQLRYASYLFVTYAIEVRADHLYPIYQDVLTELGSRVVVKSIILEEEGHLEEMIAQLSEFLEDWQLHADHMLKIEAHLFQAWLTELEKEIQMNIQTIQ